MDSLTLCPATTSVGAAFSAVRIEHGQWQTPSTSLRVIPSSRTHPNRVSHSIASSSSSSSRRRPRLQAGPVRMQEAGIVTTNGGADSSVSVAEEEGPISTGPVDVSEHVAVLKAAAKTRKVPPVEVFAAIRAIEKAKVDPSNFLEYLGCTQSPGRTWMLVFTAGQKLVRDALNGGPGGGQYLPVSAVQNFDAAAMRIENGVYLGPLGALAFEGRFSMKKRILAFLFDKLKIKVGSLPHFTIKIGKKEDEGRTPTNTDPFFIWMYADDEIIVAKGRGGGLAFWCRCRRVAK